jgi:hypothetical protein
MKEGPTTLAAAGVRFTTDTEFPSAEFSLPVSIRVHLWLTKHFLAAPGVSSDRKAE